jgi:hypothetical protein
MVDPAQRRLVTKLVLSHVEPSSRKAVRKAALEQHEDVVQLGLAMLSAIPPSPVSHQEGGGAGLALLQYLKDQPGASQAIRTAAAAAPKTMFPTSRRDIALVALQSTAAASPSAFAQLGIQMIDECYPPYPYDGAVAGEAMLGTLSEMPLDDTARAFLTGAQQEFATLTDHSERAEHATRTFQRLMTLEERRAEVVQLAEGQTGQSAIQETPVAVRVGGVVLPRRRA